MNQWEQILKEKFGDKVERSVLMKQQTTIGVGGIADFFYLAKTVEEIVEISNFCYQNKIPFIVIGWGSNIIVSDYGFNGLVVKNESGNIVINKEKAEIIADSGISVGKLLTLAASNDLGGIEFLAGIPGTLAGAVNNNSGSRSMGIGDYVRNVTLLEEKMGELKISSRDQKWMEFEYRNSKLKSAYKNQTFKPVILTAKLRLTHKRKDEIIRLIQKNIQDKSKSQPLSEKTAGSFFKNPGTLPEQSAGFLLDRSGAKKLKSGGAKVSVLHANFVVNAKNASGEDIRRLAESMREAVKDNYGVILEEEVEYIGKW